MLSSLYVFVSCASMGTPGGGDYDFDPPKVVKSSPGFNATNYDGKKIEIVFDELVQLEKPLEKIIVTPPQNKPPVIRAISNRVTVELRDTLLLNTTYTIDFTDAVVDNNEKNVLENFTFSFSTGEKLDTLAISGKVLAANNLEPVKGIFVGLHSNLNDTAFTRTKFDRISKTNDRGEFTIRGIAEGKYRIFALDDLNRDYMYDNPAESLAFFDSIVAPSQTKAFRQDTVFKKDLTIDTIIDVAYTRFLPDNIVLRSFLSGFKRQYLQKYERPQPNELMIYFGAPTEMPKIEALNFDSDSKWALLERSAHNDTLHYWIIDPNIIEMDTIRFGVTYYKTDSLNMPVLTTDTLNFSMRGRRPAKEDKKGKKKDDDKEEIQFLKINNNLKGVMNVYDAINIEFDQPVRDSVENKIFVQRFILPDSVYVDESVNITRDTLNPRKFTLRHKWQYGDEYRLLIDSATIYSYAGLWNDKVNTKFKIKKLEDYGRLYIGISGLAPEEHAFVELLDKSDNPVRKARVRDGGVGFANLDPGTYYARIVLDRNNNGVWDTGDYYTDTQPEEVYYLNKYFEIKAYFDINEPSWVINSLPLDKQKPLEITKNKPQEKESRRKQMEKRDEKQRDQERERERQSNNQGTDMLSPGSSQLRRR